MAGSKASQQRYLVHDTDFSIWSDVMDDQTAFNEAQSVLTALGFEIGLDPKIEAHYQCLSRYHRLGRQGDLQVAVMVSGIHTEVKFFQDLVTVNSSGGRYDFQKLEKMPFLVRMQHKRAAAALVKALQALRYSDKTKYRYQSAWIQVTDKQREYIEMHGAKRDGAGHGNVTDGDGQHLTDGATRYFRDRKGYLQRGTVFHNINNMWWIVLNDYSYTNVSAWSLFSIKDMATEPRKMHQRTASVFKRRQFLRDEKRRLSGEVPRSFTAMHTYAQEEHIDELAMDYRRAQKIKDTPESMLQEANRVVVAFCENVRFEWRAGKLYIWDRDKAKCVKLESEDSGFQYSLARWLSMGSTSREALAQIACWLLGRNRQPLRWWRWKCGEGINLDRGAGAADLLRHSSYADLRRTCCVVCGEDKCTGDWSSGRSVNGPCCTHAKCEKKAAKSAT